MSSPAFSLHRESPNQAVDWATIDDELDKIPAELKDPRFDSLRHVLNILSAVDADAALDEVLFQDSLFCNSAVPQLMVCSYEANGTPSRGW